MIILDTNVISELMRARPSAAVVTWMDRQPEASLYLTTLTLAEIRFGIAALPKGKRQTVLHETFEEGIRPLFGTRVLDFDESASKHYAALRSDARAKGLAISDADALIAAIASARRFHVATRDVAPFEAAGLTVINPFEAS